MAKLFATAFAIAFLAGGSAFATDFNTNTNGNANTNTAAAGAAAASKSSAAAGASASNRNYTTNQLNQLSASGAYGEGGQGGAGGSSGGNSIDNGGNSNDNSTELNPGSVISYTYVPAPLPQGALSGDAAITSKQFHFVDPLFGMGWQTLHLLPDGANKWVGIANMALGARPDGTVYSSAEKPYDRTVAMTTAHAALCAHDPDMAEELAATADNFPACQ